MITNPRLLLSLMLAAAVSAGESGCGSGAGAPTGGATTGGNSGTGGAPATPGTGGVAGMAPGGAVSAGGAPDAGPGGGGGTSGIVSCANIDSLLPPEPAIPPACATLQASFASAAGTPPSEASLDTSRIQTALSACTAGQAVKLAGGGGNDSFITGPLNLPTGVSLWVDAGVILFGTRDPGVYGQASALISARGAGSGIYGEGTIDGQGGEPQIGASQSWWDVNGGGGSSPALIQTIGATDFTLYKIRLQNSPMFHVKLGANGFVVWGITIKTPSAAMNSAGSKLTPSSAHNTDGVDPGETATNGFIVYNQISDGDDHIAIKGSGTVKNVVIAHNHFEAGHGMSIGSEIQGGVSNATVCDLSIDGTNTGLSGGSSNGIRIKSDPSRGGLVTGILYEDVCVRGLTNPIILTPRYSSATGTLIPHYDGISIRNFRSMSTSVTPKVTILGYDAAHATGLTLDNVIVDDVSAADVTAGYANVTLGPGNVNFMPAGTGVSVVNGLAGQSTPNPCTGKWVSF